MVNYIVAAVIFFCINSIIRIVALVMLDRDRIYVAVDLIFLLVYLLWGLVLLSK